MRNTPNKFTVFVIFDATNKFIPSPIKEPVSTSVIKEPTSNVPPPPPLPPTPRPGSPQPIGEEEKDEEEEEKDEEEEEEKGEEDEEKDYIHFPSYSPPSYAPPPTYTPHSKPFSKWLMKFQQRQLLPHPVGEEEEEKDEAEDYIHFPSYSHKWLMKFQDRQPLPQPVGEEDKEEEVKEKEEEVKEKEEEEDEKEEKEDPSYVPPPLKPIPISKYFYAAPRHAAQRQGELLKHLLQEDQL